MNELLIITFAAIAAVFDFKSHRIPNKLLLTMLAAWLVLLAYSIVTNTTAALSTLIDSLLGFLIGGGIFLSVYFLSRKNLGGGDVKFMAVAGLYLGLGNTIPAIFYGTVLAAIIGLILILIKKINRKDMIPLAPFLFAGITLTVLTQ